MKRVSPKALISMLLCLALLFSAVPMTALAEESGTKLVNIAGQCEIEAPAAQSGKGTANMTDGDSSTLYVANNGTFPADIVFQLPAVPAYTVKKVVVKFESGHPTWSCDVDLSYATNNITDDYIPMKTFEGNPFDNAVTYEFEAATALSHLKINLANALNNGAVAAFWPAVAEVEIYAEVEDEPQPTTKTNVAPNATVTSVGGIDGANLVDNDESSLYVFYRGGVSSISGEAWIQLDLARESDVTDFEIAFEHLATDANNFQFTYSVYGKAEGASDWTKLVSSATANRTDKYKNAHALAAVTKLKQVKIVIESITSSGGDPWPAVAEFKIFAENVTSGSEDGESIAWGKPVHSNYSNATAGNINDGSPSTSWKGTQYPAYVDIDLEENYNVSEVTVITPSTGYSQYRIYYTLNGRDYNFFAEKDTQEACPADGDVFTVETPVEARGIRVYMLYNSASSNAVINEVRVKGEATGTAIVPRPDIDTVDFSESEYAIDAVTDEMVVEEVNGIIARRIGEQYKAWFELEVAPVGENGYDYFELSDSNGKVHIKGNDGVSLAMGVNHYLKYFCNVHISQVQDQVKMPEAVVPVGETLRCETKFPVRYAYNYCTLSYTMSYWGEDEWRNELDWLALNGVNVVLDATAQEEVWRRFLTKIGYTHEEAKDFIAGPGYYAWAYMANLSGYGGPVHDSWFEERTELARKNQLSMRKLGMNPVLQGYSGMMPTNIKEKDPEIDIIAQGNWNSFQRPAMIRTTTDSFTKYAKLFYETQAEVYGTWAHYYATDPFHEGGNVGGMDVSAISSRVMGSMLDFDPDCVWVIQAWQGNPSSALLTGIEDNREHALVLDLYAEKTPHWNGANSRSYGPKQEFNETPWVYCMLNNFGGRMGLHGHLDNLVSKIPEAANSSSYMAGIGISPEGSQNNPVLYDFLFECIWSETPDNLQTIDIDSWLADYTHRRYGAESDSAEQAMLILKDTVYKASLNMRGQGAPESLINARPAMQISAASSWGNAVIGYDKVELEEAARLLLEDYETLKDSPAYLYDVADILKQVLSNTAQEYHSAMVRAYNSGDPERFEKCADQFLSIIDETEKVLSTQKEFLLGTWTTSASELAENADDFTKFLYMFNAKSLITTWGSYAQCESGRLHDYSNRQWAGLTNDLYKTRWVKWIEERKKELAGSTGDDLNWFQIEWEWARDTKEYTEVPTTLDLLELGNEVLENFTVDTADKDPAADDSRDLPIAGGTAGSEQPETNNEGPVRFLFDNNTSTIWHTAYDGSERSDQYVIVDLGEVRRVDGLRYLPRESGANGVITEYAIDIMEEDGTFTEVATGTWAQNNSWKLVSFEAKETSKVRLRVLNAPSTVSGKMFASGAELRITGEEIGQTVNYMISYQTSDTAGAKVSAVCGEEKTENGTITVAAGSTVVLTAEVNEGYEFVGWQNADGTICSEDAVYTVSDVQADASYTAVVKEIEDEYILGDTDENGDVDSSDATLVLQHYAGIKLLAEALHRVANVNGDNQIDSSDATLILQYYAQIITKFPIE